MATLDDLNDVLVSVQSSIERQTSILIDTLDVHKSAAEAQRRADELNRADRTVGRSDQSRTTGGGANGAGESIATLGGRLLGGGARAAAGAGLLGLAIPAFFGGLLAGDAALGWLSQFGSGFNFDNLKAATIGFTEMIADIDEKSLITLGAIMGISMVGGTKAAMGLGTMGVAISAFLGGLLVGDGIFSSVTALGGNLNFGGMKSALVGFSDIIIGLSPSAMTVLGVLMGGSAVTGMIGKDPMGPAKALGSMGLAITAFLGGLLFGDGLFASVIALGGSLDFASTKQVLAGFSSSISALSPEAGTALAAIIGASGVAAAFGVGPKEALGMATIMTGIGAGISGLMFGLFAGSAGIEWLQKSTGATGDGMASAFKMFNDSVGELNNKNAIIALGAIIGAGSVIGSLVGPVVGLWAAGGIFAVMTGIGLGISGLMFGLFGGSAGIEWLQKSTGATGDGMVSAFKMFNDSIVQITPAAITKLKELSDIGGLDITKAMTGLGAGIVALMGTGGLAQVGAAAKEGFLAGVDWLFGTDLADGSKSTIEFLVDSLDPLKKLDITLIDKMDEFGGAIDRFASSFVTLGDINTEKASGSLSRMIADVGGVLSMMDVLMKGGPFDTGTGPMIRLFGNKRGIIDFGPGLNNIDMSKIEELANFVNTMRDVLGGGAGNASVGGGAGNDVLTDNVANGSKAGTATMSSPVETFNYEEYMRLNNAKIAADQKHIDNLEKLQIERAAAKPVSVIINSPITNAPITAVNNGGNSSSTMVVSGMGGRADLDARSIPAGAQ